MGDFNIILNQPATQPPPIQRYDLQGASSYYAYEENGRSYHAYKPGIYPYPADECERNRCDMLHHLVHGIILGHWTRRDGLAAAVARPLVQQSADSILDLGCGSGNWVIDMADQFPDAEVVGVDLVGGQPKDTPRITWRTPDSGSNNPLDFDGDQDWGFLGNTFDLIHAAHLCGGISDWSAFFRKIRKYLRPRSGQVELIEIDLEPRCDDGTLPRDSALYEWWRMMLEAGRRSGKSIAYPHNTGGLLQDARFADIKHQEHQLPFSFSANWVRPGMKTRAEWYNIMVTDPGDRYDPVATFNAYSMALFTRYLGLSRAQVDDLVARVSLDVSNPNYHIFHVLHVWTARRPGSDESHLESR